MLPIALMKYAPAPDIEKAKRVQPLHYVFLTFSLRSETYLRVGKSEYIAAGERCYFTADAPALDLLCHESLFANCPE